MFNVRVYGILIHNNSVLITDEWFAERQITKFPGGGLQFGESTHDCLKREFMEELELPVSIDRHFYTVDFFQESAFNPSQQVISIYYMVTTPDAGAIAVAEGKSQIKNRNQVFRWLSFERLHPVEFTFPIDKKVAELLALNYQSS